ncbi:hypothetical protein MHL40_15110 [Pseudomonas luteola]|uniref:hypothetical protein n=1 Tax=Pseudomonas luteola TaxID=47886 RepID=UPI001EF46B94|nr:hypothetical protein [Pseudomonas luteola]MCG7373990.1 hypothetical protein [Pseudomonas luteola]
MTPYEQEDIRTILGKIYSPSIVKAWDINDRVAETLLEMSAQITNCSKLMALVPRPLPAGGRPLQYISKEARRMLMSQLKEDETYLSCVKAGALGYRTRFEEASLGL